MYIQCKLFFASCIIAPLWPLSIKRLGSTFLTYV